MPAACPTSADSECKLLNYVQDLFSTQIEAVKESQALRAEAAALALQLARTELEHRLSILNGSHATLLASDGKYVTKDNFVSAHSALRDQLWAKAEGIENKFDAGHVALKEQLEEQIKAAIKDIEDLKTEKKIRDAVSARAHWIAIAALILSVVIPGIEIAVRIFHS